MTNSIMTEQCNAECRNGECHYAECRGACIATLTIIPMLGITLSYTQWKLFTVIGIFSFISFSKSHVLNLRQVAFQEMACRTKVTAPKPQRQDQSKHPLLFLFIFSSFEHVKSLLFMEPNNTKNSSKSVIFSYLTMNLSESSF